MTVIFIVIYSIDGSGAFYAASSRCLSCRFSTYYNNWPLLSIIYNYLSAFRVVKFTAECGIL